MAIPASTVALTGADQLVRSGLTNYRGFAIRETTGTTAATVRVYDGTSAAGILIDDIQLIAGESDREWYPEEGINCETGLFVKIVSGAVEGSMRIG